ncbi:MAG: peptide chain release factor 3 [Bacteroidales bacterium]|nr:peptide chain release factor 3 [Bacteroidales bacterium]HOI32028.1 peptide chain release factor 3 [Bacteroidales bacterium]
MSNQKLTKEIKRRRTFAIISHPDAGKTTLTEKLLLYGGAIQVAGAVKSNKIKKTATSDWMEIERQRGISVATSVMGFEYNDLNINILDTPGHQDFAEDTFRTLTAVDSVIVVIDVAKGVEPQTEKLVKVCRMRKTPIIVFINKLDRPGKDGFGLLDEVEQKLELKVTPLSWPINMGPDFKGVYNIYDESLYLFEPGKQRIEEGISISKLNDPELDDYLDEDAQTLREELELVKGVYPEFEREQYLDGSICPVFFGSALNNFGVKELLDCFIRIAPTPIGREAEERRVAPDENNFSGFVFKIHANMDPNHRDRIAFVRIVSGRFERNKPYHHVRLGRSLKFSNPTAFMAQKKSIVDEAFPGDIVGLYDSGNFKIGDTLTEGELLHYKGIPSFSPELFRYVENADPMKSKQLAKGLDQLMDEGVAQLFTGKATGRKIIGTVGALQFEVIQYRLLHEYGASCRYEPITLYKTAWIVSDNKAMLDDFKARKASFLAFDKEGRDVFLADSPYALQTSIEKYPDIKFHFTSEF